MQIMKKILCISTGGTFNKIYNPVSGELDVDIKSRAIDEINTKWKNEIETISIIGKDSLMINNSDRLLLLATINLSKYNHIIIIHGTDTIKDTASYLADSDLEKCVVLAGAMVPFSIDPVEASVNFGAAYGFLQGSEKNGIFIAMNGLILPYNGIRKDRAAGKFAPLEG